jgi:hypothetical protein
MLRDAGIPWQRLKDIRVIPQPEEPPVSERELRCVICDGDMMFEVPPCTEGHDDCPELVCTRCGAAEVVAPIVVHMWWKPQGPRRTVAPQQRRAA